MFFDASTGGIRMGGASSSLEVPQETIQISGSLDVMGNSNFGGSMQLGKLGVGQEALWYGSNGTNDYLRWEPGAGHSGASRLELGRGTDFIAKGATQADGDMEWIAESGVLRVGKELVLADSINDSDGTNVDFGKITFGTTNLGGFEYGDVNFGGLEVTATI